MLKIECGEVFVGLQEEKRKIKKEWEMIRKALTITVLVSLVIFGANFAMAGSAYQDLEVEAGAKQSVGDFSSIGSLDGNYGAGSLFNAQGEGYAYQNNPDGYDIEVSATGGALGNTDSYTFDPGISGPGNPGAGSNFGVGSASQAEGVAGAAADAGQYFSLDEISGNTSEVTGAGSYIGDSAFNPDTMGVTTQNAEGSFYSDGPHSPGKADSSINTWGNSYSESHKYTLNDGAQTTKGMGTEVGSFTNLEGETYYTPGGQGTGSGFSWEACGTTHTETVQEYGNGMAKATATGSYGAQDSKMGGSNYDVSSNYEGSAEGGTSTSVTTVDGMQGSVNRASAHMSVSSQID